MLQNLLKILLHIMTMDNSWLNIKKNRTSLKSNLISDTANTNKKFVGSSGI
jgi:hypothetical protein